MARHIRKGDTVIVTAGNDKGLTGEVLRVMPADSRVVVQGVNIRSKHLKPTQANPQGGITRQEAPVNISNVMLLDPKSNEPTRVGKTAITDENSGKTRYVRLSVSSGETIE